MDESGKRFLWTSAAYRKILPNNIATITPKIVAPKCHLLKIIKYVKKSIASGNGATLRISRKTDRGVPPTRRYKFFVHPCHIEEKSRYMRVRTMPIGVVK